MIHDLEPVLAGHPFFEGLPPELLRCMVGCARNVRFEADQSIFQQGEAADQFYLLRAGRVALETRHPSRGSLVVHTLEAGEVIGWSWLFPPYRWAWSARAVQPTRALAMDAQCLRKKFEEDPALGYAFLQRAGRALSDRLHAARLQALDLYHNGHGKR